MSKEIKLILPFDVCTKCPFAQDVIEIAKNTFPYTGDIPTKLETISVACIVTKDNIAYAGGIRSNSWETVSDGLNTKAGETVYMIKDILTCAGNLQIFVLK